MYNFLKMKVSNISGCTTAGNLSAGKKKQGSNWERSSPKWAGYLDISQNSPKAINFPHTKQ
jgi:hypothetical protein